MMSNEKKTVSFRKILVSVTAAVGLAAIAAPAMAAGGAKHPRDGGFSFAGPFGTFDQGQLQRGYKVYKEVCASCHGMDLVHFRNLGDKHGPFWNPKYPNPNDNPVVKALAKEIQVADIDSETGEALMRDATTADRFPNPYPNPTAAAAANGGAMPPDLSVLAKARHDGANYIYSLLSGYSAPPAGLKMTDAQHYNPYMPGDMTPFWTGQGDVPKGGFIAMPPPLSAGQVTYDDGTEATVDQMSKDVAAFIAWTSEPKMVERKQMGFGVLIFLLAFAGVTYASYRRIWKGVAH